MTKNKSKYYIVDKEKVKILFLLRLSRGNLSTSIKGVFYQLDENLNVEEVVADDEPEPYIITTEGLMKWKTLIVGKRYWWMLSLEKSKRLINMYPLALNVVCEGYVCIDYPDNVIKLSKDNFDKRFTTYTDDSIIITNKYKTKNLVVAVNVNNTSNYLITIVPGVSMVIPRGTCFYLEKLGKYGCFE